MEPLAQERHGWRGCERPTSCVGSALVGITSVLSIFFEVLIYSSIFLDHLSNVPCDSIHHSHIRILIKNVVVSPKIG